MTLKATGHQWYWSYEYPDQGNVSSTATLIGSGRGARRRASRACSGRQAGDGAGRYGGADLVTGTDVIHCWFIPAFGVQEYAITGPPQRVLVQGRHEGTYYGQCTRSAAQPPLHADRGQGGVEGGLRQMGRADQDNRRRQEDVADHPIAGRALIASRGAVSASGRRARWQHTTPPTTPTRTATATTRTRPASSPAGCVDQPQGYRHALSVLRDHRRGSSAGSLDHHPRQPDASGQRALQRRPTLQRDHHRARPDHGVLHGHAGADRRVRQLVHSADDRLARHGVPAHEQHQLLAAGPSFAAAARLGLRRRRRRHRLDDLSAALHRSAIPDHRWIWRSSRSIWPAPRRSWARSTSSPRSSTCARPA